MAAIDEQNDKQSGGIMSGNVQTRHPGSCFFSPHMLFLFLTIPFGIFFIFLTPPFQVPDEPSHLFRAWQIAEGRIFSEIQNNRVGGYFPAEMVKFSKSMDHLRWSSEKKISPHEIVSLLDRQSVSQDREFVAFRMAIYSPVPYLPQTAAILLAKPFHPHPFILFYWVRSVNFLIWAFLIYLAIRLTPVYPNLFMLLALTPMSLCQASSLSADAFTNGLALLIMSLALRFSLKECQGELKGQIWIFILLVISLSLCKHIYFLFAFLFLFIPHDRVKSGRRYFLLFSLAVLLALTVTACWSAAASRFPVMWRPGVDPAAQIQYVKNHPLEYIDTLINSIWEQKVPTYRAFVGRFGWTGYSLGGKHTRLWMLLLLIFALVENRRDYRIESYKKILGGLLFATQIILTYTLLYLFWSEVGADRIDGVQGRYFIPIMPLFFLVFYNTRVHLPQKVLSLLAGICTMISLICAAYVIAVRFYV